VAVGVAHQLKELRELLAPRLGLTEDDLRATIPSGAGLFANRLHWAATYMAQAGLIVRPRRGFIRITQRGRESLQSGQRIDNGHLSQFQEFIDFRARATGGTRPTSVSASPALGTTAQIDVRDATPVEAIQSLVDEANASLAGDLLERIRAHDPVFLERLVLHVLTKMGYGDRATGTAEHLGRSGDEGVDGVIRQDALGLERIYIQAKRYAAERAISRPDIQAFVGALHGQQADRGVFITTSRFTSDAQDYADRVNARIILLDGEALARLMIRHNVGVQDEQAFTLKRIDEDFFSED
jgi:restriction system protein